MKITLNIPQEVVVEYSDANFYQMIDDCGYPKLRESDINMMLSESSQYITILKTENIGKSPLSEDAINDKCQRMILSTLIRQYND